jgi:hypothetical protein
MFSAILLDYLRDAPKEGSKAEKVIKVIRKLKPVKINV